MKPDDLLEHDTTELCAQAAAIRGRQFGNRLTYSRKVFIPLTTLCRDVCSYCTFAKTPRAAESLYMPPEKVLDIARAGAAAGCKEALFTLGERPELRYGAARKALARLGHETTLDYLHEMAGRVFAETGLLPHINAGALSREEVTKLRPVAASMGMMLESLSPRLCAPGQPHHGSPDKQPGHRLAALEAAGEARVPFTTGLLIGIGETRAERIADLSAIAESHVRHGHVQEVIIQNFRAKADTRMASAPEPALDELRWTIAASRILLPPDISVQAPPNLSAGHIGELVSAGIDDFGGISPVTPDHVNPEAPWPAIDALERAVAPRALVERLTIYPHHLERFEQWLEPAIARHALRLSNSSGLARDDAWAAGSDLPVPRVATHISGRSRRISETIDAAQAGELLDETDIVTLFEARGPSVNEICEAADDLRRRMCGDSVSYVVNRNINYTNICAYRCTFCAFSKGKTHDHLRGKPYNLDLSEIAARVEEAAAMGVTEVCMQGGIHPSFTGETYLSILETVRAAVPSIHIHAFSPLEIWHGASTLGLRVPDYLRQLKAAGLGSLPGTAAEILDDEIRQQICPDKLDSQCWLDIIEAAHEAGLPTTSTIMFGHVERPRHWARHLTALRDLQRRTGGITEFVPLPFVHMEAPVALKGKARSGPTFREAMLMHAIGRLVLHPHITNIQASWVKLGLDGLRQALKSGVNDAGGTLINESITRAAGASHGQHFTAAQMREFIIDEGRTPWQRTTLYNAIGERCETPAPHKKAIAN